MKHIEFRRHSRKQGPGDRDLSPEGVELARIIGQTQLQGQRYTHL